ncbi:phosphatidate cytidylyltransferase [Mucor velutinosus]|uniref:Phosphatidate cytidylyltransferase n=1 Tax=Mucor velutinosus TaxID=708070 RepID=A0AAN7DML0_9FUNG|nr:phosphatidate cytidylyltransferase [Mucor velutinosus]
MKFSSIIYSAALLVLSASVQAKLECSLGQTKMYESALDYSSTLQDMIDEASRLGTPVVYIDSGLFEIDPEKPIVLKKGVSLKGSLKEPTILSAKSKNGTASIEVYHDNLGWAIQNIVFENVNIVVEQNKNEDETAILGNLFFNGGRGSVIAQHGQSLYIDGNVFLRDHLHQAEKMIPSYNDTNTGILFRGQKSSVVSNNIFGMDLRKKGVLEPVVNSQLRKPLQDLKFIHECLGRDLTDEQGYLASGLQMYYSKDITIKQNIMNATFPDTHNIAQDHGISVVGSNQTYIYQNFIAGWKIADMGGAIRLTSAVDGYILSNYFANAGVMMYAAVHADFLQVSNMVVHNNFLYRFLNPEVAPDEKEVAAWLYEGITFFDFYTARLNYTIRPPIWNASVPISPWGWHIVLSDNKFGASEGLDPNIISLGNLDPKEALVDSKNCYVTEPLIPGSEHEQRVPLLWRQNYEKGVYTKHGGKIPQKIMEHTGADLADQIPAHLRNLQIPDYWKAFTLKNDTVPMLSPDTPCYSRMNH